MDNVFKIKSPPPLIILSFKCIVPEISKASSMITSLLTTTLFRTASPIIDWSGLFPSKINWPFDVPVKSSDDED